MRARPFPPLRSSQTREGALSGLLDLQSRSNRITDALAPLAKAVTHTLEIVIPTARSPGKSGEERKQGSAGAGSGGNGAANQDDVSINGGDGSNAGGSDLGNTGATNSPAVTPIASPRRLQFDLSARAQGFGNPAASGMYYPGGPAFPFTRVGEDGAGRSESQRGCATRVTGGISYPPPSLSTRTTQQQTHQ